MKKTFVSLLVALGLTLSAPLASTAAPCTQARQSAERSLFGLQFELAYSAPLSETHYIRLRAFILYLEKYWTRADVRWCQAHRPGFARWSRSWRQRYLVQSLPPAREQLDALCTPLVRSFLRHKHQELKRVMEAGDLARARTLAFDIGIDLRSRALFRCPATRVQVNDMLSRTLPWVHDQVRLPTVLGATLGAYQSAQRAWNTVEAGLGDAPGHVRAAVAELAAPDRNRGLRQALTVCIEQTGRARARGASPDRRLATGPGDAALPLRDVHAWCSRAQAELGSLSDRAAKLWAAHEAKLEARWQYLEIKGWAMRKVYDLRGRPDQIRRHKSRIIWVYAGADCASVGFSPSGALIYTDLSCRGPAPAGPVAQARSPRVR